MHLQNVTEIYFLLRQEKVPEILKKKISLYFILINEMYMISISFYYTEPKQMKLGKILLVSFNLLYKQDPRFINHNLFIKKYFYKFQYI